MIHSDCQLIIGSSQGKKRDFAQAHLGGSSEVITGRAKSLLFFGGITMPWDKRKKAAANKRYRMAHPEKVRESIQKWYESHREQACAHAREYARTHRKQINEQARKYYAEHRDRFNERQREKCRRNPQARRARKMAGRRIVLASICEICGGQAEERHHSDYSQPLVVIHVCARCHQRIHAAERCTF
jgi:hypothetical protein